MGVIAIVLKYLPAILALKNVASTYKEEHGTDKPFYISRRFWAVVFASLGTVAGIVGWNVLPDGAVDALAEGAVAIISIGTTGYGVAMGIKGTLDREKKPANVEQNPSEGR